jgi:hypothetical protein
MVVCCCINCLKDYKLDWEPIGDEKDGGCCLQDVSLSASRIDVGWEGFNGVSVTGKGVAPHGPYACTLDGSTPASIFRSIDIR